LRAGGWVRLSHALMVLVLWAMRSRIVLLIAAGLPLCQSVRADLSIHFTGSIQLAPGLPPAMADAMKKQFAASMPAAGSIRIKEGRVFSSFGAVSSLIDYAKPEITLIHAPSKSYSTIPAAEFGTQIDALMTPEGRAAMARTKTDITTVKSGKTAVFHEVPLEESVVTISIETPAPNGPPMQMRMEVHKWVVTAEGLARFPELKEWDIQKSSSFGLDPATMINSLFAAGPMAEQLRKSFTGLPLKTETDVFLPAVMPGRLIETVMEVDNFSAAPIPSSVFEVPSGYKPAPFATLMQYLKPTP